MDFFVPLRFPSPLANLTPRSRHVRDTSKLGCEVVDGCINLRRGVEGERWKVETLSFSSYKIAVHRIPTLARRFYSPLVTYWCRGSDLNKLSAVVRALVPEVSPVPIRECFCKPGVVDSQVSLAVSLPCWLSPGGNKL